MLSRTGPHPRDVAESSSDDDEGSGKHDAPVEFPESTLSRLSRVGLQPRDVAESSSDDDESSGKQDGPAEFPESTLSRFSRVGLQPRDVVEISSDDDESSGKQDAPAEFPESTLSRFSRVGLQPRDVVEISSDDGGDDDDDDSDDCVVLDCDPDQPLAATSAKAMTSGDDMSDEVEIVWAKGQIACKDFPHSRHLCVDLPFSTTSHVKHCSMCYCFVCDVPAPCKYWWQGLLDDDHCHATDKEAKWKKLRQAFKCKSLPASYPEKHLDVVYPTTPSARQVSVGNLPYHIDSEDLPGLFYHAGIVVLSEILYDRETGQSRGCGPVTMNTVEEAEKAVELYHHSELCGRLVTVSKAAATGGARAEETPSPRRTVSSLFMLFVNNLPPEVDGCALKQLFSGFGEVVHAKVMYHHTGARWESKEFGVVTMATLEGLNDAIRGLNKKVWRGRELRVG